MRKEYKAFTLVEMLIVMGIIIILMAVGIASGRFAIRRANKIEHQNAAEQIYQAAQSYYSDYREYPSDNAPADLVTGIDADTPLLSGYIDDFDGGSEATYYYDADDTGQIVIICVSLGGDNDVNDLGIYCTGNGIGETSATGLALNIPKKEFNSTDDATLYSAFGAGEGNDPTITTNSLWNPDSPWE
jgi:type II secretory pathway pseudopilin PulG